MVSGLSVLVGSILSVSASHAATNLARHNPVKCKVQTLVDDQGSGKAAFTFLLPSGWEAHNSFRWLPPSNTTFSADLSLVTPDQHAMVDCVEHTVLQYMSGFGSQPGKGVYIGKATDFLRFRVSKLTSYLKDVSDVQIDGEENTELPPDAMQKIGDRFAPGDSMHQRSFLHQAGFLRVRFKLNGTAMTASLGTLVFGETSTVRIPGQDRPSSVSQVNRVGPTMTIMLESRAPQARVEEAKIIASSFQMTPAFHAYWVAMTNHAGQVFLHTKVAEQHASDVGWHERSMASFRKQMDGKSESTHDFCNMVANQQDYKLGDATITIPNEFTGWYDAQAGQLMVDDEPQFVPSGPGTQNFKPLQAVHAGG